VGAAATVRAIRIGYVGELGWELHIPTEWAAYVYDQLWEAGQEFEIANIGYRAIDSLRMEKGYLYWSSDITPDYHPYEAGLGFRVHLKSKGDFIGRRALEKIKAEGNRRVLSILTLEKDVPVYGAETIMRQGKVLGYTTSANFGHTIGKPIVYGYLPVAECEHNDFEVESFGKVVPAVRHDQCVYDPERRRLLS
jgi:4-methylaminobutanoate oxidase (formaldehyde-forming)